MYAPPEFNAPVPPRPPMAQERVVGLIVLLLFLLSCFFFALSADEGVFNPLNTARPITQTWRAQTTGTPRPPRPTPTSRFGGGAVQDTPLTQPEVVVYSARGSYHDAPNHQLWLTLGGFGRLRTGCAYRAPSVGQWHDCR
ncbi:MAG: hypothetical protein SNJ58_13570 [Aggregatilineales bacterium]